jgi:pyruvate dehydrogenase E2 component (dihydrolipoamide acetyltransferase)
MATNILMPALSPTMTEGNLARWLKQEGERIKAGDVIAEIETDKATMEVEAVDEGILGRILVPAGTQGVKVNDVIAVLVEAGEAVPAAGAAPKAAPAAAPAPVAAPVAAAPATIAPVPASGDRVFASPLARRLAESKATIPHFYVSTDVEIDALLKIRADLNARSPKDGPGAYKLSVNDLVIKATAVTLRRFPNVNAMWTEDAILQLHDVDISVAVSIPDGLITPIVKNADIKGLAAISNEMKDLAARAKTGKLKPEEFQGGGFSISNMGMYGVRDFAAIINPPQAGILAVSAGEQRPVVKNGALAIATVMTLTLSVDHRVIDGALAAEFLQALKRNIEDPLSLML